MESRELSPETMRTLVQHPAWHEFMKSYLLPMFSQFDASCASVSMDQRYESFTRGMLNAIKGVIEKPYQVAGCNSPLQKRFEWDEDLTTSEGKRKYKKRDAPQEDDIGISELPRRVSFPV